MITPGQYTFQKERYLLRGAEVLEQSWLLFQQMNAAKKRNATINIQEEPESYNNELTPQDLSHL